MATSTPTTNPFFKTLTPLPKPTFPLLKPSSFFFSFHQHQPTLKLSFSIHKPPSPFTAFVAQPTSDFEQEQETETTPIASVLDDDTSIDWNAEQPVVAAHDAVETGSGSESEGEGETGGFIEPPEEAKLFVGNLPYDVDSEKLANLFDASGVVEIAEVIYNRETDRSRGFGFVTMRTVEEAEKAVEMFNSYDVGGRLLTVNKAAPRGSRPERPPPREFEPSFRIYVGNLPWDVDNDRLEQLFSEHGKVLTARVVSDRETGRSRGFGFVSMASELEMNDAIAALDGQSLEGRPIRVNVAEQRPQRTF